MINRIYGDVQSEKGDIFQNCILHLRLLILALGIILNTKSGLGVSPIISVSYSTSQITGLNFGNMTFLLYGIFVFIELILHTVSHIKNKNYSPENSSPKKKLSVTLLTDVLQFPLSLVFTRFMNLFSSIIPTPTEILPQFAVLLLGIIFTGIGVAMSLNMRIIPNPGDGIVQAISDFIGKSVGFTKNCFDLTNICITIVICLIFAHKLIGIGIGTLISVLGVGRVIALFNHLFMDKMLKISGLKNKI